MLLVRTYVAESPIHGLGLYAGEDIPKNTIVWKFNPIIDKFIDPEEIPTLPEHIQEFINTYAYLLEETNNYCLGLDNDRFTNHSENPNTKAIMGESKVIAIRDIKKGEEITSNYREFDKISRENGYHPSN